MPETRARDSVGGGYRLLPEMVGVRTYLLTAPARIPECSSESLCPSHLERHAIRQIQDQM